ncbi:cation diffusion facilitator family transporter [Nannocystis exedens]|uniref:Cation diffusion facilitator family transporter n=1 Tax=Nannocystis exedens TaxID=54 RepID=A0A1I1T5V5_9BACT|nr:cation diffusion facilitator family transporter [Nannocystis exedens]PCC66763.1 ferrous iron efflux protein F [Nannocystis exedens]SFD54017.1 cation diffusion facilitator family transporter [Nannocystis exedens]
MAGDHSTAHIIQSLVANLLISVAKGVAAVITGSGAMLAETLHSLADCGNQLLLLLGVRMSRRPPSEKHPLGHGRSLYFWSFMVALLLFSGGGVFSLYEGIHKLGHAGEVESVEVGLAVLALSLAIEGWATLKNIVEMNKRRRGKPFFQYLRDSKDSDLVVVFGENAAACLGLIFALLALLLASVTGDPRWDAIGTLAIGVVLIGVAVFLAIEVKSLLVGESADPEITAAAGALAVEDPKITRVLRLITVQQGPGEVLVALKLGFAAGMTVEQVAGTINEFETRLRGRCPEVKWCFVEPDIPRT